MMKQFSVSLKSQVTQAVFWECKPFSAITLTTDKFECVFLLAPSLASITPDPKPFASYFNKSNNSLIAVFDNLGGDATLISPTPYPNTNYAHLFEFHATAPDVHLHALWQQIGEHGLRVCKSRSHAPMWMSTSGQINGTEQLPPKAHHI